jgi:hypothetical protein
MIEKLAKPDDRCEPLCVRLAGANCEEHAPAVVVNANIGVETPMRSERRTLAVIGLVFLPLIAAVLFTAGGWVALNFLAYAIIVFAAGYCIITLTLPAPIRSQTIVLAPATGILVTSALTVFWVRLGLPIFGLRLFGSH